MSTLNFPQTITAVLIFCTALALPSCTSPVEIADFKPTQPRQSIVKDARIELLWADGKFTAGSTLDSDDAVLFTDIPNNRIMRYNPKDGKTNVWKENMGSCNGLKATTMAPLPSGKPTIRIL